MKFLKLLLFTSIFFVISSPFVSALSVKPLTLKQIVSFSDVVFKGTVLEIKVDKDIYESGYLVKYYTFQVQDCLKGDCGETITIKQLAKGPAGLPQYEFGKTYLMFIPEATEKTGLVAPVGIDQGVYPLKKSGEKWTIPSLRKNSMSVKTLNVNQTSINDYETFKALITSLVEEETK